MLISLLWRKLLNTHNLELGTLENTAGGISSTSTRPNNINISPAGRLSPGSTSMAPECRSLMESKVDPRIAPVRVLLSIQQGSGTADLEQWQRPCGDA
jgi:hypothetical protein